MILRIAPHHLAWHPVAQMDPTGSPVAEESATHANPTHDDKPQQTAHASTMPTMDGVQASKTPSLYSSLSRAPSTTASSFYSKLESLQGSPLGPAPMPHPCPESLPSLPPPKASPSQPQGSPSVASEPGTPTKNNGLIRRLSRGARNTISRKQSQKDLSRRRDQSSGPVVLRRRSDSRTVNETALEVSDLELDEADDTVPELDENDTASPDATSNIIPTLTSPSPAPPSIRTYQTEISPSIPVEMLEGTIMTKVTRKKRKQLRFTYDDLAAKIFWSTYRIAKQIYIDDIKEIRYGDMIVNNLEEYREPLESKNLWITITYSDVDRSKGRSTKSLHLVAKTEATCHMWISSLQALQRYRESMMEGIAGNNEQSRKAAWRREMCRRDRIADKEQRVDFAEIKQFCRSFSIFKSGQDLRVQFARSDVENKGSLNFQQYLEFFRRLTERQDIRRVFEAAKSTNDVTMSREDFLHFVQCRQGVDLASEAEGSWNAVYDKLTARQRGSGLALINDSVVPFAQGMTFETFQRFLLDEKLNPAFIHPRTHASLHRPLNEYFISSSHNTYLMGRQFGGESSSEGYVEALKKNCRCVEIDCWDGDDGRPCVTHGRSLTSKVSFLDCIKVINHYAFHGSDYPLIISLEVHCGPEQQRIMAQNMKDVFSAKLILAPINWEQTLPSPEDLRGRVLIKVKEPKPEPAPVMLTHRRQRSKSAPTPHFPVPPPSISMMARRPTGATPPDRLTLTPPALDSQPFAGVMREPRTSLASNTTSVSGTSSDESDIGTEVSSASSRKQPKTSNIVKTLGDMGVYTRGIKFHDFRAPASRTYNHIFSFNETTFESKCKTPEAKRLLEMHNANCLMRVYPRPNRITSSNFNPLQFWRRGVQMAATNWQTYDLGSQVNDAMFAAGHDATGYVLKPDELRQSAANRLRKLRRRISKFKIVIISAQHLTAPLDFKLDAEMNPYVELEVYSADDKARNLAVGEGGIDVSNQPGMSGIGSPHRRRTQTVHNNGYDPIWEEAFSMTVDTKYPSLVFVRWTVWNSPDTSPGRLGREPFATFTAKLSSLQQGYRHIRLCNNKGEPTISTLFVHIQKEQPSDPEPSPMPANDGPSEGPRSSEDSARTGKDFLRWMLRTPSQHRRARQEADGTASARSTSLEK